MGQQNQYPDTSLYGTERAVEERLEQLSLRIKGTAPQKRDLQSRRYGEMVMEAMLLGVKLRVSQGCMGRVRKRRLMSIMKRKEKEKIESLFLVKQLRRMDSKISQFVDSYDEHYKSSFT